MEEIIFIMCKNEDGFHGEVSFFLRYVILDGVFQDNPDFTATKKILEDNPAVPVLISISPCRCCRAKGITGPTEIGYLDRVNEEEL